MTTTATKTNRLGNSYSVLVKGKRTETVHEYTTRSQAMHFARLCRDDGFEVEVYRGGAKAVDSPFNAPIWRGAK